jgi:NADH dehydrogenase (ubiquinone) 1 alpha subcomplex subunit 5
MCQSLLNLDGDNIADTKCRINDVENKIGAGLIEEVLQVAEGELVLVSEMADSKP